MGARVRAGPRGLQQRDGALFFSFLRLCKSNGEPSLPGSVGSRWWRLPRRTTLSCAAVPTVRPLPSLPPSSMESCHRCRTATRRRRWSLPGCGKRSRRGEERTAKDGCTQASHPSLSALRSCMQHEPGRGRPAQNWKGSAGRLWARRTVVVSTVQPLPVLNLTSVYRIFVPRRTMPTSRRMRNGPRPQ